MDGPARREQRGEVDGGGRREGRVLAHIVQVLQPHLDRLVPVLVRGMKYSEIDIILLRCNLYVPLSPLLTPLPSSPHSCHPLTSPGEMWRRMRMCRIGRRT